MKTGNVKTSRSDKFSVEVLFVVFGFSFQEPLFFVDIWDLSVRWCSWN